MAPIATPKLTDTCWPTLAMAVAEPHLARLNLGVGYGGEAGELQRAQEAADEQHRMIRTCGVAAVNSALPAAPPRPAHR